MAKKSINKISVVGRKYALRRLSEDSTAMAESSDPAFRRVVTPTTDRYLSSWLMVARSSVMNRLKSFASVTYEFAPSCR